MTISVTLTFPISGSEFSPPPPWGRFRQFQPPLDRHTRATFRTTDIPWFGVVPGFGRQQPSQGKAGG